MSRLMVTMVLVVLVVLPGAGVEAGWSAIPKEDWAVGEIPWAPSSAAVILLREGTVFITEDARSSYVDVYTRVKILTDEGKDYGSISLYSSDYMRTKDIAGRTTQPDGTVTELAGDATFEKKYSDYYGATVVSCALPSVVPGAIVEYRYRTYFDSIFYGRMWYFQAQLPTLVSRVSYDLPTTIAFAPVVYRTLPNVPIDEKVDKSVRGGMVTYTMRNAPPVPDEPSRFPFEDIAARAMVLPISRRTSVGLQPIFESWKSTVETVWGYRDYGYDMFLTDDGATKKQAQALVAGMSSDTSKAEAIYRFVRDEMANESYSGVWIGDKTADKVLAARRADLTEKSLLLYAMLDLVKVKVTLAWANPRDDGRVEQAVPNPNQFGRVLVVADLSSGRVFLDPSDRQLAFGRLPPSLQGVSALVVTKKKQDWTTTPQLAAEDSQRDARLRLAVDSAGVVSGSGSVTLTGAHGWRRLGWKESQEQTVEAWTKWLEDSFSGYDISAVTVDESIPTSTVAVSWSMALRPDEALDSEATVASAEPLAVAANPFTLQPVKRLTPVQLAFPDLDRVHLELSWPEGWQLEGRREPQRATTTAGDYSWSLTVDEGARTATVERSLRIAATELVGREAYAALRELYAAAVDGDGSTILLVAN